MTKAELLAENQRLQLIVMDYKQALDSKSQLLIRVLKDLDEEHSKKSERKDRIHEEEMKYASKCGRMQVEIQILKYRLELAKIAYHRLTGEYNPEWPVLTRNDLDRAYRDILPSIPHQTNSVKNNSSSCDILSIFEQSSNGI